LDRKALDLRPPHQQTFHPQRKHPQPRRLRRLQQPKNRHKRQETDRFKPFTYEDLLKRDKVNLDIFWLKDDALEDSANLPAPEIITQDITDDLEAALEQFATIAEDLKKRNQDAFFSELSSRK